MIYLHVAKAANRLSLQVGLGLRLLTDLTCMFESDRISFPVISIDTPEHFALSLVLRVAQFSLQVRYFMPELPANIL